MKHSVLVGDVVEVLPTLEPNSFDAVLCDPPYALTDIARTMQHGKNFTSIDSRTGRVRSSKRRQAGGFMGKAWDAELPGVECWREVLRVLKPGAMLLAFGGTRTHHRLMCALEDAGFEIRDTLCWLYGSGFPKSLDISKALDKAAGAERLQVVGTKLGRPGMAKDGSNHRSGFDAAFGGTASVPMSSDITAPATDLARRWSGYGTALKPAAEFIVIAMKPLDGTFAANATKWGVAGINVDESRIETGDGVPLFRRHGGTSSGRYGDGLQRGNRTGETSTRGRWPSNVLLDETAARQLDQMSGECPSSDGIRPRGTNNQVYGVHRDTPFESYADSGGASRFFYTSKVSTAEREGSDHPTMKPIDLTTYLAKLILPPQRETPRRILVPFAGVGSEMIGAILAGWDEVVGIEKDPAYAAKARERIVGTAPLFLTPDDEKEEAECL